jgi:hypothetical protein
MGKPAVDMQAAVDYLEILENCTQESDCYTQAVVDKLCAVVCIMVQTHRCK